MLRHNSAQNRLWGSTVQITTVACVCLFLHVEEERHAVDRREEAPTSLHACVSNVM